MKRAPRPGFFLVVRREWRWLLHDRVALILIFGVPLFAFVVLSAVFSQPVIRGLGVVIVDGDRSDTSRAFIEQVAASPNLGIVRNSTDLASASQAIRSGEAIAAIYIPANFERDLKAQRRPQIVAFYNQQFLTAAGVASQGMGDSLTAAAATVAPAALGAPTPSTIGALVAETIVLVNPQKNYAQFLLRTLLPMVLHVVIALCAGYAVGSEFRRRSMRTWLACAGGNPLVALIGKLTPLFVIFFAYMLVVPLILEGLFDITFKGEVVMMIAAGTLLIISYLALGSLFQLLLRDLATGLGLTSLVVSPAFGYAGVGFPVIGMNLFAQIWGALLPLRWYMAVLLGQAARGLPVHDSAPPFAILTTLTALYALLAFLRLRSLGTSLADKWPSQEFIEAPVAPPGIGGAFAAEWRRVLTIRGAFVMLVLAPLIYGFYYPQPYLTQILHKVPIVVVDSDLTELSRNITQALDASGALTVAARATTLAEAREALDRGEAFAVVGIPPGTERDVLKGNVAHIPVYADATYMFIFRSMANGISVAISTVSSELAAAGARVDGSLAKAKLAATSPVDILLQPVFNPVGGYASYVVPAAFVLILQQTLLMGAAMLTSGALARASSGPLSSVLGRGIAHLTIYLPALALYLIVLPRVYGFSALGHPLEVFALGLVFILATSFMGQAAGAWFRRPETPTLIFLATSLPQFFLAGFSWPREAIPKYVIPLSYIFPSDAAIEGLVRINQLGASLWEIVHDWQALWFLAIVYFALAALSAYFVRRKWAHG